MSNIPTREQTSFLTGEVLLNFLRVFPSDAKQAKDSFSHTYKVEIAQTPEVLAANPAMINCISLVAQHYGGANWQKYLYGPLGKLRWLHEAGDRKVEKYPYYNGLLISNFTHVISPKMAGMENENLADPATFSKFKQVVAAKAPSIKRFPNLSNPLDIQRIEDMNRERMQRSAPLIPETDYYKTLLPVSPLEIWDGCYGKISGRAYWLNTETKKTVNLGFDGILLTRTADRIYTESSADEAFATCAPAPSMAPPAPALGLPGMPLQMPAVPGYPQMPAQPAMPGFPTSPGMPVAPAAIDWSKLVG